MLEGCHTVPSHPLYRLWLLVTVTPRLKLTRNSAKRKIGLTKVGEVPEVR